ncbi:hypothetical protein HYH02_012413 [Chlamydomonas schloesseri]|uniref:Uncharacterized protein n=1 Tax=Chlamydomonas schloesseri TaxID=2026947 RepID=A0A835SZ62_9CHLO|nr:hypothetical protein HYH02_012413 [Chlamydomonas schloesseri]|eukprot:KAG2434401.1 hypothetical protein HYH02_012413 [Chlamydomonas schloesseri]
MPLTRVVADPWAGSDSVPQFAPLPVDTTSRHVPLTAERAEELVRTHIERTRPSLDAGVLLDEAALVEASGLLSRAAATGAAATAAARVARTNSTPSQQLGERDGVSGVGLGLGVQVGPQLRDGYDSGPPTCSPSKRPGPRIGEEDEEEEEEAESGRAAPSPATRARMLDPDLMAAWMGGAAQPEAAGGGGVAGAGQSELARGTSCPEAFLAQEAAAAASAGTGDALEPLANHHMWMANRGRALGGYDPGAGHTGLLYCAKGVLEAAGGARRAHLLGDGWQARDTVSIIRQRNHGIGGGWGGGFLGESRGARLTRLAAEGAPSEVVHSLAAVIIQSYCRGWKARREVARMRSLRRSDAEAAAARASALAAAAALAREQERCRRQLRAAAKDCLLAVQAQQDYELTRSRLAAARGLGAGAAAAPPPPPPSIPRALWGRCQELGLDPIQILLDGGMLSRQIEDIIAASQLAAQLPRRVADAAARMCVNTGDGFGTGAANATGAAGRYGGGSRRTREDASSGGGGGGGGGGLPNSASDDGGAGLSSAARANSGVFAPDAEGSASTNVGLGTASSFVTAASGGLASGGSGYLTPRVSLPGHRSVSTMLRASLAGSASAKQLLPLGAGGGGVGGGGGRGGGGGSGAGRAYNTAELVEQLLQQQALSTLTLPNGPGSAGPLGVGRKTSMAQTAVPGAAAGSGGMVLAAGKLNPARRMSASGAVGAGGGVGSGGGGAVQGGGAGGFMANRRPNGGFAAGPTSPYLGGVFAGAGAALNAASGASAPGFGRLSMPANAFPAQQSFATGGGGMTGTRAQLAGPSGRQRRLSDSVGGGDGVASGLVSQASATAALLPCVPPAPSGAAPDSAYADPYPPLRARSFIWREHGHGSLSAPGVPALGAGAAGAGPGAAAGGGPPLAPIRTTRMSHNGSPAAAAAAGPAGASSVAMAALLANMGVGSAATSGAGQHGSPHVSHPRAASTSMLGAAAAAAAAAAAVGSPRPSSAMLQGLGLGLGSATNSPLAAVAAGGGAFARLAAHSSASSFGDGSPGLPLRRRHSYVGSPTPSSSGGESLTPAPGLNGGGGLGGVDGVAMLQLQAPGAAPRGLGGAVGGAVGSGGSMSGPVGAAAVAAALGRAGAGGGSGSGSGKASPGNGSPRPFTQGMVARQASSSSLGPFSAQHGSVANTPGAPLPPLLMAHGSLGALHGAGAAGSGVSSGVSSGSASPSVSSLNNTPGSGGVAGPVPPGAGEVPFGRASIRRGSNLAPTPVAAALAATASPPPAHPPPHPPVAPGVSGSPITARRLHSLAPQAQGPMGVGSSNLSASTAGTANAGAGGSGGVGAGGGGTSVGLSPVGLTAAGLVGGLAAFPQSPIASPGNSFSGLNGPFASAALVPSPPERPRP